MVRIYQQFEVILKVGFLKSLSASQINFKQQICNGYNDKNKNGH